MWQSWDAVARRDWYLDPSDWIGIWTQATVSHKAAKLRTAIIAPLESGPKKPDLGQQLPQHCSRKLKPIALAEVVMKLAESNVIEHIESILHMGLGTPAAAALIVRAVRGWALRWPMLQSASRMLMSSSY